MNNANVFRLAAPALRWMFVLFLLVAALTAPFVLFEEQIESLAVQVIDAGPGKTQLALLIGGALALDVVLPVPSSLVNAAAGAALGFALGMIVSWLGMTFGCLLGYWIGATGGAAVVRRLLGAKELERAARIAENLGVATLVLMRAVPVLAEASTIAAGAARYPLARFVATVAVANTGIAAAYAGIGAFAWSVNSFLLAVAGAVGFPVIAFALYRAMSGIPGAQRTAAVPFRANIEDNAPAGADFAEAEFAVRFRYPVAFTRGVFRPSNPTLAHVLARGRAAGTARCLVVLDGGLVRAEPGLPGQIEGYFAAHPETMRLLDTPLVVPGGESVKAGFSRLPDIFVAFQRNAVDRHAFVIAVGGGAVLDAVGFAAATAHRGIRHIRVPTTVLGQNDSGVGVKNAVNLNGVKNYAGSFAPPFAVLNDFDFLARLPRRERIAGISEAVKVALIRDGVFFAWLEDNAEALAAFEPRAEEYMVRRSAELHLNQIVNGGDPFETGSARPLDFGHWSAHKLEAMTGHEVRHGEAVAIGIALDARYSVLAAMLPAGEDDRIVALLDRLGLPVWHPALCELDGAGDPAILAGLREFQEHLGGELTITLLSGIGQGREVHDIDSALIAQAMLWLEHKDRPQ